MGKCPCAAPSDAAKRLWQGSAGYGRSTCTSSPPIGTDGGNDGTSQQFGIEQLRVLTVTTSEKRIETMLDALRDVTSGKGSELFLFIDEEHLRSSNPLEVGVDHGEGECGAADRLKVIEPSRRREFRRYQRNSRGVGYNGYRHSNRAGEATHLRTRAD